MRGLNEIARANEIEEARLKANRLKNAEEYLQSKGIDPKTLPQLQDSNNVSGK